MRLIDADKVEAFIQNGLNKPNGDIHQFGHDAIEIMTCVHFAEDIDPVHAAGGCYCCECAYRNGTKCGINKYGGYIFSGNTSDNDFCSRGKRKEVE